MSGRFQGFSASSNGYSVQLPDVSELPLTGSVILFDLDGTLVDSVPDICNALNTVLASAGRRPLSRAEAASFLGQGSELFMKSAVAATGSALDDETIRAMASDFLDAYADNPVVDTAVYPGVFDTLDDLVSRGCRLALCTNKPSHLVGPVTERLSLSSYFPTVVCGDHVPQRKPNGDHILETIRQAGAEASSQAVMVGDNINDFTASNEAGIPSVAVTFGYAKVPHDELGATALVDHFSELVPTIDDIFERSGPTKAAGGA